MKSALVNDSYVCADVEATEHCLVKHDFAACEETSRNAIPSYKWFDGSCLSVTVDKGIPVIGRLKQIHRIASPSAAAVLAC
jgi:hypothetical protein